MKKPKTSKYPDIVYAQEIKELEKLLLHYWNAAEPSPSFVFKRKVNIYCWRMPGVGLRVAEVGLTTSPISGKLSGTSGCSFVQSDTETVLFLAERWILDRCHFAGSDESDLANIEHRLKLAMFGVNTEEPVAT